MFLNWYTKRSPRCRVASLVGCQNLQVLVEGLCCLPSFLQNDTIFRDEKYLFKNTIVSWENHLRCFGCKHNTTYVYIYIIIGKDALGQWRTTALKEYPPALCRALARSFAAFVTTCTVDSSHSICEEFWNRCEAMVASYGQHIGPDYAGWDRGDRNSFAQAATFELLCA